ncbi:MAG: hypothetical protein Q4G33_12445, partial [bacterium]|nr:hypothetical protein [bacterium]
NIIQPFRKAQTAVKTFLTALQYNLIIGTVNGSKKPLRAFKMDIAYYVCIYVCKENIVIPVRG